jgi:entericidin A
MRRVTILLALIAVATAAAGCNTVQGFGEDMRHLGNSISNAANK